MQSINTAKTTWDLSPLLTGDDDPRIHEYRKELSAAATLFADTWRERTDYLERPDVLLDALNEFNELESLKANGREYYYFGLRSSVDAIDPKLKARENQAIEFLQDISNQLQFFWLNIGTIDEKLQSAFLTHKGLASYHHWLEQQFRSAKHRLSEAEEKIMLLKSTPAHSLWVQMTSDMLAKDEREVLTEEGKTKIATEEEVLSLLTSKQKKVRDVAVKAMNAMLDDHADVAVTELNAILGNKKIDDQLRRYERPDAARHHSDDIDSGVVDALIAAVSDRYDIAHRYYRMRAKLVGLKKLAYHEKTIEYGSDNVECKYPEASRLVHEVFIGLDSEFADIYAEFLANGHIDAFPRKGKRGGAFCAHHGIAQPTYVMLNHTDKLRDVMTIAHEMGHAINNELVRKTQKAINFGTPMATAEVASTFMEDFVVERLLKEADDEAELSLRIRQLDDTIATIFRQIAFYRFEQDLHETFRAQGYLAQEEIGALFIKHIDAYLGPIFGGSKDAANWWMYVPHFRSFFYVYSYASGLLISKAMQAKVRQDKSFIKEVKIFLSAGLSKSPQAIFADMKIDITDKAFWKNGLEEIDRLLIDTVKLAKKLGKI
ncbi:MAG TPA: M3 family oligoendopeptidase [Candidatus Saccharimonadia bacterium]